MSRSALLALMLAGIVMGLGIKADASVSADSCSALLAEFEKRYESIPYQVGDPGKFLYFLHVPRTAGRTFFSCFVKPAYKPSQRCPKSYDKLRLDTFTNCSLLASHDDFSVADQLPLEAAMFTQIRDPVDRTLSAFEMALEVGSRYADPKYAQTVRDKHAANIKQGRLNQLTIDIWPWSVLAKWFAEDIWRRRQETTFGSLKAEEYMKDKDIWIANRDEDGALFYHNFKQNESKMAEDMTPEELGRSIAELDPWRNPVWASLEEFAGNENAKGALWNGQAFQLLGLTAYSQWSEADNLRRCSAEHPFVEEALGRLALRRLRSLFHVGAFERLTESMASLAGQLGLDLDGPAYASPPDAFKYEDDGQGPGPGGHADRPARHVGGRVLLDHEDDDLSDTVVQDGQDDLVEAGESEESEEGEGGEEGEGAEGGVGRSLAALRRKQVRTDDSLKLPKSLRAFIQGCAGTNSQRSAVIRRRVFMLLRTPQGQWANFDKEKRKKIDPTVIDFIERTNKIDRMLHTEALTLLERSIKDLQERGRWQEPPSTRLPANATAAAAAARRRRPHTPPEQGEGRGAPGDRNSRGGPGQWQRSGREGDAIRGHLRPMRDLLADRKPGQLRRPDGQPSAVPSGRRPQGQGRRRGPAGPQILEHERTEKPTAQMRFRVKDYLESKGKEEGGKARDGGDVKEL